MTSITDDGVLDQALEEAEIPYDKYAGKSFEAKVKLLQNCDMVKGKSPTKAVNPEPGKRKSVSSPKITLKENRKTLMVG